MTQLVIIIANKDTVAHTGLNTRFSYANTKTSHQFQWNNDYINYFNKTVTLYLVSHIDFGILSAEPAAGVHVISHCSVW